MGGAAVLAAAGIMRERLNSALGKVGLQQNGGIDFQKRIVTSCVLNDVCFRERLEYDEITKLILVYVTIREAWLYIICRKKLSSCTELE